MWVIIHFNWINILMDFIAFTLFFFFFFTKRSLANAYIVILIDVYDNNKKYASISGQHAPDYMHCD